MAALEAGGGSSLPDWISAISQLVFLIIFILIFLGVNQRFQIYVWKGAIKSRLALLESMALEAVDKTKRYMLEHKGRNVEETVSRVVDFFVIQPVSIEPTDIIRRMDHLFNVRNRRVKGIFNEAMPEADWVERSRAETAAEIAGALNFLYKYIKHLLILGEKTRNWLLITQLQLIIHQVVLIAETLRKALDDFLQGIPVGDAAGPIVAVNLAGPDAEWREVEEDTVASEAELEGRRLVIIKARGPGSTVGKPGAAVEKIVEELVREGRKPSLILTVDAALKLEGEKSGSLAEGVGAAIGDPGPEKIRIERTATRHGIPLRALVVKMSMEEAITGMTKEIFEGVMKAVEKARRIILDETRPGDTVVVVGVGNTAGVA